jgi:hypothetical protein
MAALAAYFYQLPANCKNPIMDTMQIRRAFASLFRLFQIKSDLPELRRSETSSSSLADLKVRACAEKSASLWPVPRVLLRHRLLTAAHGRLIGYEGKSLQRWPTRRITKLALHHDPSMDGKKLPHSRRRSASSSSR